MPRPLVTVSYAQSLDGSLAARPGQPLAISGAEAMRYTHQLRAQHAAIVVGIGTVLADNPRLTARIEEALAPHQPQPVILDSHLRCPPNARLHEHPRGAWIVTTDHAPLEAQAALEAEGARVLRLPTAADGRIHLPSFFNWLGEQGIGTVMVEGGSQIITAFLREGLAQRVVVTIAPRFVGGVRALAAPCEVVLHNVQYQMLGNDVIVEGEVR